MLQLELEFNGRMAGEHQIDFYDVSRALIGFQRSLAITTHLVVNGEVITQAPALANASILALPPEEGSWKIKTMVVFGAVASGLYAVTTADRETPLGHLVSSAYDYVISESLGVHVDYEKTLLESYEERIAVEGARVPKQAQLDSVIEKCEAAVKDLHRPIMVSKTASEASILRTCGGSRELVGPVLNRRTYEFLARTEEDERPKEFIGWVSSYNINTHKGRLFLDTESRPIPFELAQEAQTAKQINKIVDSLRSNARIGLDVEGAIPIFAYARRSSTGRLKGLYVLRVGK